MPLIDLYQRQIAETALSYVGCHYLWGAAGHRPNTTSGILSGSEAGRFANRVRMHDNVLDRRNPYLYTATCDSGHVHSCNGRNLSAPAWPRVELTSLADPPTPELQAAQRAPERHLWPRVNDEPAMGGHIVWGEACQDVMHFDCIGFINFCIWRCIQSVHRPSIMQILRWWKHRYPDQASSPCQPPYQTGDILVGPGDHHIVFVISGEKVHAKSTHWGVVREPLGALGAALPVRPTNEFLRALWF